MARGPAYPYFHLERAIEMTRKFFDYAKRQPVDQDAAVTGAWSYTPTSSSGVKTLAALKYFGLIEEVPGTNGKVKVSDRGYRILVDDEKSPERAQAVREAALSPTQYKYCWDTWGKDMPPSMRSGLLFDRGFVATTVDGFLADYKKSMEYAGFLRDPAPTPGTGVPSGGATPVVTGGVDSSKQLNPAASSGSNPAMPQPPQSGGTPMRQDVFSLAEGPVTIHWPSSLSAESLQDFKDWLKILERKISRSVAKPGNEGQEEPKNE